MELRVCGLPLHHPTRPLMHAWQILRRFGILGGNCKGLSGAMFLPLFGTREGWSAIIPTQIIMMQATFAGPVLEINAEIISQKCWDAFIYRCMPPKPYTMHLNPFLPPPPATNEPCYPRPADLHYVCRFLGEGLMNAVMQEHSVVRAATIYHLLLAPFAQGDR